MNDRICAYAGSSRDWVELATADEADRVAAGLSALSCSEICARLILILFNVVRRDEKINRRVDAPASRRRAIEPSMSGNVWWNKPVPSSQ